MTRRVAVERRPPLDPEQPRAGARFQTSSLATRLRMGLLADHLALRDVAALEFPVDRAHFNTWCRVLAAARQCGDLSDPVDRKTYRTWRDQLNTIPPKILSYIERWLDAPRQTISDWEKEFVKISEIDNLTNSPDFDPPPPAEPEPHQVSDKTILNRLQAGEAIATIHRETGASMPRIRCIKKKHGVPNATPGPKPKGG